MSDSILVEREGVVATVCLNRPDRMNALNLDAWIRLSAVMHELSRDDDLRCVVIRGAGGNFAAGADIAAFETERHTTDAARVYGEAEHAAVMAVAACRHPTVALIEGACVGGGLEIAVACDLRICGRSSRFGVPINRLGLTMAYPELQFFLEIVGKANALEILLEGQVFDADRALSVGLVHRVREDDGVADEAYDTAARIAKRAPLVNRWHKKFIRRLSEPAPLSEEELAEGFDAFDTEDYQEGYRAFLEKRPPDFRGR